MKTRSTLAFLALCFGMVFSAMAQDAGGQDAGGQNAAGQNAAEQAAPSEDFHRTYSGKIGGKYAIKMDLWKNGNELKGSYKYAGKDSALALSGTVEPSGEFTMNETVNDQTTGTFAGTLSGDNISGQWSAPDGSKKMNFEAYKTAEFKLKPRK